ncbi:MAG TPA: hypothetical protein VJX10_15565 [Pseudonocardiaceae bacterium]|nr:hypothetical protein [Pseudonocardiaceae bacterium]
MQDEPKAGLVRRGLAEEGPAVDVATAGPDGFGAAAIVDYDAVVPDPDFLPRAFARFTPADAARTRGGTGLGLAIVDGLAGRDHCRVEACDLAEGGAGLVLTLPAASAWAAVR